MLREAYFWSYGQYYSFLEKKDKTPDRYSYVSIEK